MWDRTYSVLPVCMQRRAIKVTFTGAENISGRRQEMSVTEFASRNGTGRVWWGVAGKSPFTFSEVFKLGTCITVLAKREENNLLRHSVQAGRRSWPHSEVSPPWAAMNVQSASKRQSPVGEENRMIHMGKNST